MKYSALLLKFSLALLLVVAFTKELKACHAVTPLNFQITQVAGGVNVNASSSQVTCGCTNIYWLDIEVRCVGEPFDGAAFNPGFYGPLSTYPYFQSAQMNKPGCVLTPYPTTYIPYTSMCPGVTYQVRVRENHNGQASTWTTALQFTVPGTSDPLVVQANATDLTICAGQCATLSADVVGGCDFAPLYTWSNGANTQTTQVCPTVTTTYTVSVEEQCSGFTDQAQVTITVLPPPVAGTAAISDNVICQGQNVNVSLTGYAGTIQWQSAPGSGGPWTNIGGATNDNFNPGALAVGEHCFRAEVSGCGAPVLTNVVCVTVNPVPTINVSNDVICAGQTGSISATPSIGGGSYAWTPGGQTTQTINLSPGTTTTYNVEYNLNGCIANGSGTITVNPQPSDLGLVNQTICLGDNATITANPDVGGGTYSWSPGGQTTQSINVSPGVGTTTYTLTYTVNGCTYSETVDVIVNPLPTVNVANAVICEGENTTLTAIPDLTGGSYLWNPGGQTTNSINVSPNNTTTYGVTYTLNGCEATDNATVTVNPQPTTLNLTNETICDGQSVTLTGNPDVGGGAYSWSPGGQTTQSITVSPSVGTTTYTLYYEVNGCDITESVDVIVNPQPTVNVADQEICEGENATLTAVPDITGGDFSWNPGGQTTNSITVSPAATTTYEVTYTLTGCVATDNATVTVHPNPVANFDFTEVCEDVNTALTSTSTVGNPGNITTYEWDINANGNVDYTTNNASHNFNGPGQYDVTLYVETAEGCNDEITQQLTVHPLPVAVFNFNAVCFGNETNFVDASSVVTGNIVDYNWDLGDGNTSNAQNPDHTYASAGTYNVTLTVTTDNGCSASVTNLVDVLDKPIANFTFNNECYYDNINFTDASSTGIPNFEWDFDDGNTSTDQNPSHSYAQEGTYDVTLIISTNDGCADTITQTVIAYPQPVADFETVTECLGDATAFTDLSTVVTIDNDDVTGWAWDFGDGTTSTDLNPTHTFATSGSHTVTLTVTTNNGCEHTVSQTVEIWPLPIPDFTAATVCLNFPTDFTDNSTDPAGGNITDWAWDFGDGTTSTDQNPTHTFATNGTHIVTLTVTTDNGCSETVNLPVEVLSLPVADFTFNNECYYDNIYFTDASSTGIPNFVWDFGDGNSSTNQNPSHSYAQEGLYDVTLIIFTNDGCSDTVSQEVIAYPQPEALFEVEDVCLNNSSQFNDLSTITPVDNDQIVTWNWSFGDGNTSSLQNPNHTYSNEDQYTVTLEVVTNNGCSHTFSETVNVYPLPVVDFSSIGACEEDFTSFINNSTISNVNTSNTLSTWDWSFGDGGTSNDQNPQHVYSGPGQFNATLTVTSNNGCSSSAMNNVTVFAKPIVSFTGSNLEGCSPVCFTINAEASTSTGANIDNYTWNISNGMSYSGEGATLSDCYTNNGGGTNIYDVELVVTTEEGCTNEISQEAYIRVHSYAVAGFSYEPEEVTVINSQLYFNNNSSYANGYTWYFEPDQTSTQTNPIVDFGDEPGDFYVELIAWTDYGCNDTISTIIEVKDEIIFYVPNTFTPDGNKFNEIFQPVFTSGFDPYDYHLMIFNRWGEVVFESFDASRGWNGQYGNRGEYVRDGTYVWKIEFKETMSDKRHSHAGHVNVLR